MTAKKNGLFGKIRGEYTNSYDTADVQKYVQEMSTTHRNIYWSVYSFTPESAAQAGLNSLKEWEDWVKLRTYEIAEHLKIRYDDLEYIAAVHLKEGQPHVHVGFWDKSQEIFRKTVSPVIADNIRIDAIKHTFREQFNVLHSRENELITQMRDRAVQALSKENGTVLAKVQQMMNALKGKIPTKGRCAYQYMPQDLKVDLYNIMAELINNCEQLRTLYADILDTRETYNELLHNDDSEWGHYQTELYKDELVDEITNKMCNTILRAIVEQRRAERAEMAAINHHLHTSAFDVALAALNLLNSISRRDMDRLSQYSNNVFGRGDLSKEIINYVERFRGGIIMNDSLFLRAAEVAAICDVSIPKAYKMMEEVNTEMAKGGYLVISGRVNKRFFYEKIGCAVELNNDKEK